jgi:hypothetical protein
MVKAPQQLKIESKVLMKTFLAILGAGLMTVVLISCAETSAPVVGNTNYPYAAYATTSNISGPANSVYRTWTTVQLQERRAELYQMVPRFSRRTGSTTYTTRYVTHGGPLPQQDEIRSIEGELNRRYRNGDKTAYFDPDAPHVTPYGPQSG